MADVPLTVQVACGSAKNCRRIDIAASQYWLTTPVHCKYKQKNALELRSN